MGKRWVQVLNRTKLFLLSVSVSALVALSACDSAEERAEEHFENALELLESGDVDRAIVEFRNVFQLNGQHLEARRLYAKTMRANGNIREAFGSYLLVAEQNPDDLEARLQLARIAFETQSWEELERHGARAFQIAPDDVQAQAFMHVIEYRKAVLDKDAPARREAARKVAELRDTLPNDLMVRTVIVDNLIQDQELTSALEEVDNTLEIAPNATDFLQRRLGLLRTLGRDDLFEEQLIQLVRANPADTNYKQTLIRWYISRDQPAKAEEILRADAYAETADTSARITFIAFVQQTRGPEAARGEIEKLIAEGNDVDLLRSLRAGLDYDAGKRNEAIAELENIVATGQASERLRDIKVALARMLAGTGNAVSARQRVEEVLSEDPSHVEALKMRAGWLIEGDKPDEAILALRSALDQAPEDPQIMTLMASAYLRSGSRDLAGEMYSLAVDASRSAPEESVRYARFLIEDDKLGTAESILINSLRIAPGNIPVLVELARVYQRQEDWPRNEQVEATLRRLDRPEAVAAADGIKVARLRGQQRTDEALAFLEGMIRQQGGNPRAELVIVQTHLRNGDFAAAEQFVDEVLASEPDNRDMRFLKAGILVSTDRAQEAETIYRDLIAQDPGAEPVWRALYAALNREGRFGEAKALLREGVAANPDAANLQWALAGELERDGDIDGAIAIYESLYESNSNSLIVANNLASLISTYKTDQENLDRAWAIARRLRGLDRPAFQDTYGWIALRRGDLAEALAHLEPAAAGLPQDALVQYHLGVAYEKLGRTEDAIEQFTKAVEIGGPADSRPQLQTAREEIARLTSLQDAKPSD